MIKNNKLPLDNTPFQEFIIQCMGETYNFQVRFFKKMDKRNKKYFKKIKFGRYHPGDENFDPTKFNYDNTSGNIKN